MCYIKIYPKKGGSLTTMLILAVLFAYLVGAFPTGYLIGRHIKGKDFDIRGQGSGSMGYANAKRVLGTRPSFLILFVDILKGAIPIGVILLLRAMNICHFDEWFVALIGIVTIIGHCYPIYIGFRGGKGVATTCGVLSVTNPIAAVLGFLAWSILSKKLNISSLGSLLGIVVSVLVSVPLMLAGLISTADLVFVIAATLVILFTHRENLRRLFKGDENHLS